MRLCKDKCGGIVAMVWNIGLMQSQDQQIMQCTCDYEGNGCHGNGCSGEGSWIS